MTPGLMVNKIPLSRAPNSRLAFVFGSGFQVATSQFHSYNHALIVTGRISF